MVYNSNNKKPNNQLLRDDSAGEFIKIGSEAIVICAYCGQEAKGTKEHIISCAILDLFPE
ncbi:MAG TPA: hypothetical protein PK733_09085 [Clostridiales bacterium]|nr:hypothetical protein [Clostridiales bacterium]